MGEHKGGRRNILLPELERDLEHDLKHRPGKHA